MINVKLGHKDKLKKGNLISEMTVLHLLLAVTKLVKLKNDNININ